MMVSGPNIVALKHLQQKNQRKTKKNACSILALLRHRMEHAVFVDFACFYIVQ
jgi:hypothetical protein